MANNVALEVGAILRMMDEHLDTRFPNQSLILSAGRQVKGLARGAIQPHLYLIRPAMQSSSCVKRSSNTSEKIEIQILQVSSYFKTREGICELLELPQAANIISDPEDRQVIQDKYRIFSLAIWMKPG